VKRKYDKNLLLFALAFLLKNKNPEYKKRGAIVIMLIISSNSNLIKILILFD